VPSLALKYRPQTLDEMVGQEHLLAAEAPFRKLVEKGALPHSLFYGPPGCGKTTLARILAKKLDRPFHEFNATTLKIDELRKLFKSYANALQKPLIFIDEVHRLSKTQQEVLLPYMEEQRALIVGASTQNPYYALTAAIRSRSHLFELKSIDETAMRNLLKRVLERERIAIEDEAQEYLIHSSSGDLRAMLGLLESAAAIESPVTLETLRSLRPQAIRAGASEADSHYDLASAMIKSIRGSDVDAGLYWLARLIEGGEPPEFLARRLAILAAEDIGNANPNALNLAASTLTIVEHIGYPEARIPLAQLVVYLASSPKSNSAYEAINRAQKAIRSGDLLPVPKTIKTHSKSYKYPHAYGGWVQQEYLPQSRKFYEGGRIGFERTLQEWLHKIKGEAKA
jgi:putative ATPase